jgi:hypothetical protein
MASQGWNYRKMTTKLAVRFIIDLTMTILILCALAYRITGDVAHEWIGISVALLFIVHNVLNWRWYKNIFIGTYHFRRVMSTIVNLLLLVMMSLLCITGLLHSRTVLGFLHLSGGEALRQLHTFAAYWGLIVIALHIGLHGEMIINALRNMTGITGTNYARTVILRILVLLIVIYGVKSFLDRDMGAKLFLGYSFDFWPPDKPVVLFFAANLSIMSIYIFTTYYVLGLLTRYSRGERGEQSEE